MYYAALFFFTVSMCLYLPVAERLFFSASWRFIRLISIRVQLFNLLAYQLINLSTYQPSHKPFIAHTQVIVAGDDEVVE